MKNVQLELSIEIDSPMETVWGVLVDVERWSAWTASVTSIERLERSEFGPGSKARVRQPRLPEAIWRVTEFEPGQAFTWETRGIGVWTIARHDMKNSARGTTVTLSITQTGWLAKLVQPWAEKLTRRYLVMEAQGLKRRVEGADA